MEQKFKIGDIIKVSKNYISKLEEYLEDDDLDDEIGYIEDRISQINEFIITSIKFNDYRKIPQYVCKTLDGRCIETTDYYGDELIIDYDDFSFDEPYLELVKKRSVYSRYLN